MFSWLHPKRRPLIIAHRGSSAITPENTLAAFHQALDDGADAIEFDVRLTRDGEVVVFHDSKLNRTTDGSGYIRGHTLTQLKRLSAGSWFRRIYANERVPTLGEVFELLGGTDVDINVEMKVDHRDPRRYELVERCCELIVEHHVQRSVLLSSFDYALVKRAKQLLPRVVTGVLYHPVRHIVRSPVRLTRALGAHYLILNRARLRQRIVRESHKRGVLVAEYTVNTTRRMERALRFGVDAVFTDNPASMRKFLLH